MGLLGEGADDDDVREGWAGANVLQRGFAADNGDGGDAFLPQARADVVRPHVGSVDEEDARHAKSLLQAAGWLVGLYYFDRI